MCQFLSLIITKSGKIYGDGSFDEHERLISDNVKEDPELKDDKEPPRNTFVRIEIVPIDKDIFNHNIKNWEFKLDENIKPSWFIQEKYEKKCFAILKKVFKEQFLIGGEYDELNRDVRFVKNVTIKTLRSQVGEMRGSSQVGEMWESSRIGEMWDNTTVNIWSDKIQIKKQSGGKSVIIKRYLDKVKVDIN